MCVSSFSQTSQKTFLFFSAKDEQTVGGTTWWKRDLRVKGYFSNGLFFFCPVRFIPFIIQAFVICRLRIFSTS